MKIGARTIKTSLAIFLALIVPQLLGIQEGISLAAASAIFSMQASVKESADYILNRVIANIIGGIIAIIFGLSFGNTVLVIALSSALLIAILHSLNLDNAIGLATVTLVSVLLATTDTFVITAISRVTATIVGVLIAFLVNSFVFPPKYDQKFYQTTLVVTDELTRLLRSSLRKNSQYDLIRQDMKTLHEMVERLKVFFNYMKDPSFLDILKRKKYSLKRQLVVSRQVIIATEALYQLTNQIMASEDTFSHLPYELRSLIRERLETLMVAHEQILLKWSGRVLPDQVNFLDYKADLRKAFMEALYTEAISEEALRQTDYTKSNDLISIMAKIFEYEGQLSHLNMLMSSYMKNKEQVQMMESHHLED